MKWVKRIILALVVLVAALAAVGYFLPGQRGTEQIEITSQGKTILVEGYYANVSQQAVDDGMQVIIGNHTITVANGILNVNGDEHALTEMAGARIFIEKSGAIKVDIEP